MLISFLIYIKEGIDKRLGPDLIIFFMNEDEFPEDSSPGKAHASRAVPGMFANNHGISRVRNSGRVAKESSACLPRLCGVPRQVNVVI